MESDLAKLAPHESKAILCTFLTFLPFDLSKRAVLDIFTFRGVSKELDFGKSTCRKLQSGIGNWKIGAATRRNRDNQPTKTKLTGKKQNIIFSVFQPFCGSQN